MADRNLLAALLENDGPPVKPLEEENSFSLADTETDELSPDIPGRQRDDPDPFPHRGRI